MALVAPAATLRTFDRDGALFLGPLPRAARHAHAAIQVAVPLRGQLEVRVPGRPPISCPGITIDSDVPHSVAASGPVVHFYLAPETTAGARLRATLRGQPLREMDPRLARRMARRATAAQRDERRMPELFRTLVDWAAADAPAPAARDHRVRTTLETVGRSPDGADLAALARGVGLSPDRLRHLLRAELGVPLRRYRRWKRLLHALELLRSGESVTTAALEAGFADTAHLSRAFREAFTTPPSTFVRDSRFVQARGEAPD